MTGRDPFSPEKRSEVMRAVGHFNTAAEMKVRRASWKSGLRYRVHPRIGRTRPDFAFMGARVAVFIDGCFWHGCPQHYSAPRTNESFWREKLRGNQERDRRNNRELADRGWRVLRFWECEVNSNLAGVVERIVDAVG